MATTDHGTTRTMPLRGTGLPKAEATQIKESKGQVQKSESGSPQEAETPNVQTVKEPSLERGH